MLIYAVWCFCPKEQPALKLKKLILKVHFVKYFYTDGNNEKYCSL